VTITVKEKGPLLAVLSIRSEAPGCNSLVREVQVVRGLDYVDVTNILDKKPAELDPVPGDYAWANVGGKESVNFGFPFHVADGDMKIDIPMAVMRPEVDQIPSACKNWLEVGAWADVSNKDLGITWASLDAPLVEVGGITATLLGGQTNPAVWRKKIEPTQKLYSWAINNHWETNYRAYQDGIISFRYALRPHRAFEPAEASQFATGLAQPLVVGAASVDAGGKPLLQLSNKDVLVQVLKPSDDGKAWIVSLFNPGPSTQSVSLRWAAPVKGTSYSNTSETPGAPVSGDIILAAQDVVTLRIER
jgi:alpha-mannosidase